MKKVLAIVCAAAAVVAGTASAQEVWSKNAVGYVKIEALKGTNSFHSAPFNKIGTSVMTVSNTFATLPAGSAVSFFRDNAYVTINKFPFGWVPGGGTNELIPGEGFWIKAADAASSNSYPIYLTGEVPDSTTSPTNSGSGIVGFNALGHPYPVSVALTGMQAAVSAPVGSVISKFNPATGYVTANKFPFGWVPNDIVINPGEGFYLKLAAPLNWETPKPYTWP